MASKSDGQIIIDSEIQSDGIERDISEVKASVEKIVSQLDKLEKSFEDAFASGNASGAISDQNKIQSELNETEQDIESVTDADKKLNSQMEKDSSGKYEDLQSDIGKTDTKMSGLKSTAKSTATTVEGAADDMSSAFEELNDNLDEVNQNTKLGNLMEATEQLSGVGEKILDFASSTIEMANDVESATTRVNAYFGLTGDAAEEMAGVVENVFSSGLTDSLDEVAEAVIVVNNNIKDLDSASLENLTEQAIVLEQTMGSDMSETMRGVNALMTNFQVDASTAMDLIVAGTQNGLDKTQELGDNISEYSAKFAEAGYSAEEYFQLLNNGLEGGAYTLDKVNDAMNEVTTKLGDGSIADSLDIYSEKTQELFLAWQNGGATQKEVIDSIVADVQNATNQQDKLNLATTAFGTMAEDGGTKFIESLTSVGDTYDDVTGKAEELNDASTTSMQELQAKINETKIELAPLGTTLLDLATTYLPPLISGIQSLIGFFTNLPGPVQAAILVAGLLAAGFVVLAPIIMAVAVSVSALNVSLLPIIAVIAVIIAIITVVVVVIQNWGAITEWLSEKWDEFKAWISETWDNIKEKASETWENIKEKLSEIWEGIKEKVSSVFTAIKEFFVNIWNTIKEKVVSTVTNIKEKITSIFTNIKEKIVSIVTNIKEKAVNGFNSMVSGIKSTVSKIGDTIKNGFNTAIEFITSLPSKALQWGKDIINGIVDGIKSAIGKITDAVSNVADTIRSFLHFSVPDVGPLADADEYAPDFIELLAKGMRQNISKIKAAAEKTAAAMQIPEYNVGLPYLAQGVIAPATASVTSYERNRSVTNNTVSYQINDQQYDSIITLLNKILSTNNGILEKDSNTYIDGRRASTLLNNANKRKGYGFTG